MLKPKSILLLSTCGALTLLLVSAALVSRPATAAPLRTEWYDCGGTVINTASITYNAVGTYANPGDAIGYPDGLSMSHTGGPGWGEIKLELSEPISITNVSGKWIYMTRANFGASNILAWFDEHGGTPTAIGNGTDASLDAYAGHMLTAIGYNWDTYGGLIPAGTIDGMFVMGYAGAYLCQQAATATPTATGTPEPEGTNAMYVNTQACSTPRYATPTPWATPTQFLTRTVTAAPTRTGTPWTPTPTATFGSYGASYDSGEDEFSVSLGNWTTGGSPAVFSTPDGSPIGDMLPTVITATGWSAETGKDGSSGVAMIGNSYAYRNDYLGGDPGILESETIIEGETDDILVLSVSTGITMPVHVAGAARYTGRIVVGDAVYVRVFLFTPDYNGTGPAWFSPVDAQAHQKYIQLYKTWNYFDWEYSAPVTQTITAVGIAWVTKNKVYQDWQYGGGPGHITMPPQGVMLFDDLRTTAGADLKLPVCTDSTGGTGSTIPTKLCVTQLISVDMFRVCTAPTGIDLGDWLSYLWCNISRFFGFFTENRAQMDALIARQSVNEPFGSIVETGGIAEDFQALIDQLNRNNKYQAQNPIDWVRMMVDGAAFDTIIHFDVPEVSDAYWRDCPAEALRFSKVTAGGACMALYLARNSIIVVFLQWGLNAIFVIGIIFMVKNDLDKLAS